MAAGTCRHRDQAVSALLDGFVGKGVVDDVVHHHTAVAVDGFVHIGASPQRGDDHRHLVLDDHLDVVIQAVVALVHDLVDGERCGRVVRVGLVVGRQGLGDLGQPLVQLGCRAGIERRHRADHAGLALLDDELGVADDEQRRADDRKRPVGERRGQFRHVFCLQEGSARILMGAGSAALSVSGQRGPSDQKASGASAVTLSAPSTMLSRRPGALLSRWSA